MEACPSISRSRFELQNIECRIKNFEVQSWLLRFDILHSKFKRVGETPALPAQSRFLRDRYILAEINVLYGVQERDSIFHGFLESFAARD